MVASRSAAVKASSRRGLISPQSSTPPVALGHIDATLMCVRERPGAIWP